MPKNVQYCKWSEENMERALSALKNGDMGLNAAARTYSVPKATLKRHFDGSNIYAVDGKKIVGSLSDLPSHVEEEIENHVLKLEECMFGMTSLDLRSLAYQVAVQNNIPTRFNNEKQLAGKKWYSLFMKRHPNLSLRQPESTSLARAKGFNKERVEEFFKILEKLVLENNLDASRIYNADETGLSTVQRKPRKIIALKGKQQVGSVASGERGTNTTAVCCVSASGHYVPPMMIFKRVRSNDALKIGAPPDTIFAFNPESGYINKELFLVWLTHFIEKVRPSKEKKVLLLLDGHASHTKNAEALTMARENGVIMLALPGHTTHRLQPLDVTFFKPLSTYYINEIETWLRRPENVGKCITQFHVAQLFGKAYGKAATVATAVNGFASTGVWPVNRDVFQDHHFSPSAALQVSPDMIPPANHDIPQPTKESSLNVPVSQISPLPKAAASVKNVRSTGTQQAKVLTSSPYKKDLEKRQEKRKPKIRVQLDQNFQQAAKENKRQKKNESSWFCEMCSTESVEDMIQCMSCRKWVHENCAGVKKGKKRFFCFVCISTKTGC